MTTSQRRLAQLSATCVALALAMPSTTLAAAVPPSPSRLAAATADVATAAIAREHIPGLQIAIIRNGQIVLVLGSPGGSRIITTVLQVIVNVVDHGMLPQEAVDAPRIHHQWLPDEIFAEPFALSSDTVQILTDQGYRVTVQAPWGAAEVVAVPHANATEHTRSQVADSAIEASLRSGFIYGAHDARRPAGSAIGY